MILVQPLPLLPKERGRQVKTEDSILVIQQQYVLLRKYVPITPLNYFIPRDTDAYIECFGCIIFPESPLPHQTHAC